MSVAYVNRQTGNDTSNPLGTESNPRFSWPTQADGLVIRLARGSRYDMTGQFNFTAQGQIITDYGDPSLPKPILSNVHAASSSSHIIYGDTIFANIHFADYTRTVGETSAAAPGQHVINHQRRGNAASPAKLVSGVYLNCSWTNVSNCAIACGFLSDGEYADAAPVVMILQNDFDTLGTDAFYGSVSDYFEAGFNTALNFGSRNVSTADFINLIACAPKYVWIHDNHVDHTSDDHKQCLMLDVAAGQQGGLAVIERNVLLGYGADGAQSTDHTVMNLELASIVRRNYVRGSRLLLYVSNNNTMGRSRVHSNIFDFTGDKSVGNAAVTIQAPNVSFHNNTLVARNRGINAVGLSNLSTATQNDVTRNLFVGFKQPVALNGPRANVTGGNNRFAGSEGPLYTDYTTGLTEYALGTGDAILAESELVNQWGVPIIPRKNALVDTMARTDKRVPDFWGRFSPDGIGYIGALMERGGV